MSSNKTYPGRSKQPISYWWDWDLEGGFILIESTDPDHPLIEKLPYPGGDADPVIAEAERILADLRSGRRSHPKPL